MLTRAGRAIPASSEPRVPFDPDAIAAALGDEARGRRHFPGYRVREEQLRMAREFARALAQGGTLLLEGGTGVGKSLAYLAAAIPFAVELESSDDISPGVGVHYDFGRRAEATLEFAGGDRTITLLNVTWRLGE